MRRLAVALLVGMAGVTPVGAAAQTARTTPGVVVARSETAAVAPAGVENYSPPYKVLLRSLAFPGWGQLENDRPVKAALVMLVESGLVTAGFVELRRADRAFEAHAAAAARGDEAGALRHLARYDELRNRAVGRLWWGVFTVMLSMLDAYVDAHLRDFVVAPAVVADTDPPGAGAVLAWRLSF